MTKVAGLIVAALLLATAPTTAAQELAQPPGSAAAAPAGQFRAYWVDAFGDGLFTESQIDSVVAATKAANLNAIVAQVVRRGDCFCNRASVPRSDEPALAAAPFDPLQSLIDKAHAEGIEVHAWIIATAIWRGSTPPAAANHVYNLHGPAATGGDHWLISREDGVQQLGTDWMLDPGHPGAAQFIVDTATNIVKNYSVDGINLDRIRYPDGNFGTNIPSWGYNATAVARFQQATARTDRPTSSDPQWAQWRRDQVASIVRKVYIESYAIRPSVRVSADTITYGFGPASLGWQGTRAYAETLQDWSAWMREGILDLNIPMNYKRDQTTPSDQRRMYREWSDFAKDEQYRRQAVIGTGLYLNDIAASARQAQTALDPSTNGNYGAGWVGYSYRTPDDQTSAGTRSGAASRAALTSALVPAIFPSAVPIPAMTWKTQPTTGHLRGVAHAADGTPLAQARVELIEDTSGSLVRTQTTDGSGWFAFVDVFPARYRVKTPMDTRAVDISAGRLTTLDAAATPTPTPVPSPTPPTQCTSSVGPGIAPPASVAGGVTGFHASWYGQSGYPTLCAGQTSTATVAYYNSGSRGWVSGRMGEMAYLGTWAPEPGQDRMSPLGGDGTSGSPATGWPRYNRVAAQPASYVGPGQVSWFQFTIQAPPVAGTYRLYLRPLVEGATWMEDYGVYWVVTVKN